MEIRQVTQTKAAVLVIDDDAAQLKTIADILESEDLQPICCSTGKAAIAAIKQQELNVAILDLRLPDIEGLGLLKQLKQQDPEIKIIIHTGYASLESAMAAINEGAFAYVRKVGDAEELLAHIHRAFHAHLTSYSDKLELEVKKRTKELIRVNKALKKEITERKQVEEALQKSEEKFAKAFRASPNLMAITKLENGEIVEVNAAFEKTSGYRRKELIGHTTVELDIWVHSHERDKLVKDLKETGKSTNLEIEIQTKTGERRIILFSGELIYLNDKPYMISVGSDITERKQAEMKLQASEATMKSIFRAAPTGIGMVSNRVFKHVNDRFCEMVGYSREELLDKNARMVYPSKEEFDWVGKEKYQQIKESGRGVVETKFKRKDGRIIDVLLSSAAIDPDDLSAGVTFTALDISERKRSEEALQDREKMIHTIINETKEAIIAIEEDGLISIFNRSAEQIFGLTTEEMIGQPLDILIPEKYRKDHRNNVKSFFRKGKPNAAMGKTLVLPGLHSDGREFPMEISLTKANYGGKKLVIAVARDITERKRAEDAIKRSKEWFKAILETSRDGIVVEDREIITYANSAFAKHYGYDSVDELIGQHVSIVQSEEDNERMLEFGRLRSSGKPAPALYEFKGKQKNGDLIDSEASVSSVDISGKSYVITVIRDITARKRLEEQLIRAQKMEAIGRLAGGVAHDFNNLLTVILGNTEFGLQDSRLGEPVHLDLMNIEKAAYEARDVVHQLLTFSRSHVLEPKLVDLNKIILNHVKMLKRIIGEDIILKTHLTSEVASIWADPAQIQRLLMNLSINARDAMPKGGQFTIETKTYKVDNKFLSKVAKTAEEQSFINEANTFVKVTIKDTGKGMNKQTLGRIFDPFFTTKKVGKGTGLGLAVVYGIVKQHKGFIQVDSQIGTGTSFSIYFPIISKSREEARKMEKEKNIPLGKETILIVEDEDAVRNVTHRILNRLGYNVLTAKNGKEAVNIFSTEADNVDLVIMDVVMPEVNGPDAYKKLHSIKPHLPVIFVTGYEAGTDTVDIENYGQDTIAILQKPFTRDTLGKNVRDLLDK